MSELEEVLQKEGLLDLALRHCQKTGLDLVEVPRSLLQLDTSAISVPQVKRVSGEERTRIVAAVWDETMAHAEADPGWFRREMARSLREVPCDFTTEEVRELSKG